MSIEGERPPQHSKGDPITPDKVSYIVKQIEAGATHPAIVDQSGLSKGTVNMYAHTLRGPVVTAVEARTILRDGRLALVAGPRRGYDTFLETTHFTDQRKIIHGMEQIIEAGLGLLGKVEHPSLGISDGGFEKAVQLVRGLGRLVLPKKRLVLTGLDDLKPESAQEFAVPGSVADKRGYKLGKRPTAIRHHDRQPVDFDFPHTVPVITTFILNALRSASLKGGPLIPNTVAIEIMPDDYRAFRRGWRSIEKGAIHGADIQEVYETLAQAGAPPETVMDIIDTARETFAYVKFTSQGVTLIIQGSPENGQVEMILRLPEQVAYGDDQESEPRTDEDATESMLNTAEGIELRKIFPWPDKKAGNFKTFLQLVYTSLRNTGIKQIKTPSSL